MDLLLAKLLSEALKTGTAIAADKAGGNVGDFEMRQQAPQQQAPQQQQQQAQQKPQYNLADLVKKIFGGPVEIRPTAMRNAPAAAPTLAYKEDPYSFGSYY